MFALYQTQKQMLTLLEERLVPVRAVEDAPQSDTIAGDDDFAAFPPATTRANKRKSVLLIDDDDASRAAAVAALEKAEVPVRTAVSGQAAMELLTEETPDVIALEGEMSGEISGKDIIDRVKAVMEWVNIPSCSTRKPGSRASRRLDSSTEPMATFSRDPKARTLSSPR